MKSSIDELILKDIGSQIKDILYDYIKAESFTYSKKEKEAEAFFLHYFSKLPYFKEHPAHLGAYPIPEDPFQRAACYAMVKGDKSDTIVLIHHSDVVSVEDFKRLKPLAFSPDRLEEELLKLRPSLSPEVQADLNSGEYLYGRGVCDMKGGGAIQMALLSRYSELRDFRGNLIVLAVPDEENLSAGMRAAVTLLAELQTKYGLTYRLMINSEPHQRKDPEKGLFSFGSVGKLMPFVYVRGNLAHAGKVFEGFNPLNLLSRISAKTELSTDWSDVVGQEAAPPPTWLFLRDGKSVYDVSMPLSAMGCFSVLTLSQTPTDVLSKVRSVCTQSFEETISEMNENYGRFLGVTNKPTGKLPWAVSVTDFSQLYEEACLCYGEAFTNAYEKKMALLQSKLLKGRTTLFDFHFSLLDFIYDYIDDLTPRIVYGLIPPYYPHAANRFLPGLPCVITDLGDLLNRFTKETFGQEYGCEDFYTGISDLSYSSLSQGEETAQMLQSAMPLFGNFYRIPMADIEKTSMPCINIGPWGKDFHKLTERVLKEDLYERTPRILHHAITKIFELL